MTKDELTTWAKANGLTEDRFGHLQKTNGTSRYRLKLSSIAARYEVKTVPLCGMGTIPQRVLQKPQHHCRRETCRHDPIERKGKTDENFHHR